MSALAQTADDQRLPLPGKQGSVPRIPVELLDQLPNGLLRRVLRGERYVASSEMRDALLERYQTKIVYRPDYRTLTTSTPDRDKPVLNWFMYKEAFASALVDKIVASSNLAEGAQVLDPFGGVGTVPFACQAQGIGAVSVDLSPFPVFVSNAKLQAARRDCSKDLLALSVDVVGAIEGSSQNRVLPDVSIWEKAFDREVAHGLFAALEVIDDHRFAKSFPTDVCDIAHLALLCVAEEVSHTVKDGTSLRLRKPGRRLGRAGVPKSLRHLIDGFTTQVEAMASDIRAFGVDLFGSRPRTGVINESLVGDARCLSDMFKPNSFDLIVTSPPYPNRYDYSSIYTLELLLGFVKNRDELRSLRFQLFRSHLEAPWPSDVHALTPVEEEILACLYSAGMSSPRVFKMLLGYFADLSSTLSQLATVMKSGANAHFVVGNVRIEGQEVPVDLILASLAEQSGFAVQSIAVARYKGTNSQQARKFGSGRLRESVVMFQKP